MLQVKQLRREAGRLGCKLPAHIRLPMKLRHCHVSNVEELSRRPVRRLRFHVVVCDVLRPDPSWPPAVLRLRTPFARLRALARQQQINSLFVQLRLLLATADAAADARSVSDREVPVPVHISCT